MPPSLEHLIRTCLAKDPEDRWQTAQDIQRELAAIVDAPEPAGVPTKTPRRRWFPWLVPVSAIAALLVAIWVWHSSWGATLAAPARRVRFDVWPMDAATLPTGEIEARVSPNGHHLAFIARHAGMNSLWVRSFDAAAAREVAGTNGASQPLGRQTVDRLDSRGGA